MTKTQKHAHIEIPENMKDLPVTNKGYFKPWFVKADDFRVVDSEKAWLSICKAACWICGKPFKPNEYALVGDAHNATHRFYIEPPCHVECAMYAAQVCPFMLYPNAKKRVAGLSPEDTLAHRNANAVTKIDDGNPGEHYIQVVTDYDFSLEHQVMHFTEDKIIETQHWIGGVRQDNNPAHIAPENRFPD